MIINWIKFFFFIFPAEIGNCNTYSTTDGTCDDCDTGYGPTGATTPCATSN